MLFNGKRRNRFDKKFSMRYEGFNHKKKMYFFEYCFDMEAVVMVSIKILVHNNHRISDWLCKQVTDPS